MKRSIAVATVLAGLTALSTIAPALAFEPNKQTNEMSDWTGPQQPIKPGQEATAQLKLSLAAGVRSGDAGAALAAANSRMQAAGTMSAASVTADATTYLYTVATYERKQINSYYCGPAAIAVMSDYVWNKGATGVKYSQGTISSKWTHTTSAGTGAAAELVGANGVLEGSPRDAWPYWSVKPTSGADWSDKLLSDIVLNMPQIVNLQPWWYSSSAEKWYYLPDWKDHRSTGGHWVVARGIQDEWDGTGGPNVQFEDGAGPYGGGTGTYWTNQYTMWMLIKYHNNIVIW